MLFRSIKENQWFFVILVKVLVLARGYNLDTNPRIFEVPATSGRESYFGFSVALYVGQFEGNFDEASVLVGAPRANLTSTPDVVESGAVYRCRIRDSTCHLWDLDPSRNGRINRDINQIKDNAWIGASIAVENKTQPRVVVCGPRWINNIITDKDHWFMNGICYQSVARNAEAFERQADSRMIPLLGKEFQISSGSRKFYDYGMGQSGFALHMDSTVNGGTNVLLGNPGVHNWRGVPSLSSFFPNGKNRNTIPEIGKEPLIRDANYFGYSVTSGDYFRQNDRWYAAGAPRGANIFGRVLIFRFPVTVDMRPIVSKVFNGEQAGEYFGGSLASCDINNDGRSEIIVGAPFWSKEMEEGKVYYYLLKNNGEFEPRYIEGKTIGGRFGSVITCLNDLDHDGFEDIAIAAPYEDNRGAIYIYNGNSQGLLEKFSQRIAGEDVSLSIRGFGSSISEPRDVDGNGYVDLAIGSYLSGHATLFRSRPVVTLTISVNAEVEELQKNDTFFHINVCSSFRGYRAPDSLDVERIVKIEDPHGRTFFANSEYANETSFNLPGILRGQLSASCSRLRINLINDMQNMIDPIKISVSLLMTNSSTSQFVGNEGNSGDKSGLSTLTPVVNTRTSKTEDFISLPFAVDCGPDEVCSSILDLSVISDLGSGNRYTLGSEKTIKLKFNVANRGEAAYKAQSHIYVPAPISLGSLPRECVEDSHLEKVIEIICELGNPLVDRKIFELELDMRGVPSHMKEIGINATLTTHSDNLNEYSSSRTFTIYFDVDADIAIAGKSQDALYSYVDTNEENKKIDTIRFHHIYEVQKFGVSPIEESVLTVQVPIRWNMDDTREKDFIRIFQIVGQKDGRNFYCVTPNRTNDDETIFDEDIEEITDTMSIENTIKNNGRFLERFTIETPTLNIPPENRTIYLNCTNSNVECVKITCRLGSFTNSLTVAKLLISLDLRLNNIQPEMTGIRDIIFFVSNGNVNIENPERIAHSVYNKPDNALVGTTFIGSPTKAAIASWIVVLSVILGLLLLLLLILGLVKLGFFQRKKREELEALKAESDKNHGFVLETTSSREALDQD